MEAPPGSDPDPDSDPNPGPGPGSDPDPNAAPSGQGPIGTGAHREPAEGVTKW